MTADMSNKSVEEVLTDVIEFFKQDLSDGRSWDFVDDVRPLIARRLEEAQQKIALAKAEALEKFAYGWGPDEDVWTSKDIRKLSLNEAAEYRAKATEAGRKE